MTEYPAPTPDQDRAYRQKAEQETIDRIAWTIGAALFGLFLLFVLFGDDAEVSPNGDGVVPPVSEPGEGSVPPSPGEDDLGTGASADGGTTSPTPPATQGDGTPATAPVPGEDVLAHTGAGRTTVALAALGAAVFILGLFLTGTARRLGERVARHKR